MGQFINVVVHRRIRYRWLPPAQSDRIECIQEAQSDLPKFLPLTEHGTSMERITLMFGLKFETNCSIYPTSDENSEPGTKWDVSASNVCSSVADLGSEEHFVNDGSNLGDANVFLKYRLGGEFMFTKPSGR